MLSPYVIARQAIYWKFPSSTERLAYVATAQETTKIAWQASDDTFWVLTEAPGTWTQLNGSVSGASAISNIISSPTVIAVDTSYIVASYLKVPSTLTVSGNLRITG